MKDLPDFDPRAAAKKLLRESRSSALATLMPGSGDPYCSLVNVATAADGSPLLLISQLAVHTKNLLSDSRASLMLDERKEGDPLEGARVMLMGKATPTADAEAKRRYLARQPDAQLFAGFGDFAFYRFMIERAHLVAGFGRIVDLTADEVLTDVRDAETLLESEPDIVAHLNSDHADAVRAYAENLLGGESGTWQCVGCDPDGLELQCGRTTLRLAFPQRVTTPGQLRGVLKSLAEKARSSGHRGESP
jgi:heme oxygenase (biliverdin-IX-beta and delta-forming)